MIMKMQIPVEEKEKLMQIPVEKKEKLTLKKN